MFVFPYPPKLKHLFLKILFIVRQSGKEGERERNINVWLPFTHLLLGTWPAAQARALTGSQTIDPLVHRPALNLLSHTSQGKTFFYNFKAFDLAKI